MTDGKSGTLTVFVSHAGPDRLIAKLVAETLRAGGYDVILGVTDWRVGSDFLQHMETALERADIVVALWSTAYFSPSGFAIREWRAAVSAPKRVVPLRVEAVAPPTLYCTYIYRDICGLIGDEMHGVVLAAVRATATGDPGMPVAGDAPPRRGGGELLAVWNLPTHSANFTGREDLLDRLRENLLANADAVPQALCGGPGIGKTQLAVEYAYRFKDHYVMVWWVNAERTDLIDEQLARMAVAAGVAGADAATPQAAELLRAHLRRQSGWLIIFDNVQSTADIRDRLPQGPGHVIITSRWPTWIGVARPIQVAVLSRSESVRLLALQVPALTTAERGRLAEELGDLPLALVQAAGTMSETGMSVEEYISNLARMLDMHGPADHEQTVAATVRLSMAGLREADEAAWQLLRVCAQLAPEPIPLWLFTSACSVPELVGTALGEATASSVSLRERIGRAGRLGLIRPHGTDAVIMHRLTSAIICADLTLDGRDRLRAVAEAVLVAARPGDSGDITQWPHWEALLPHLLGRDPSNVGSPDLRNMICEAVWHLHARKGDPQAALTIAQRIYVVWRDRFGPDDYFVLFAAINIGQILHRLGRFAEAREIDEDTLERSRRAFGEEHGHTLGSTHNLAADLRELGMAEQARVLDEELLDRIRSRVSDDAVAGSLLTANNLAADLRALREFDQARRLDEDTLRRRRLLFGSDDLRTLVSATNLAADLRALGEAEQARQFNEDTLHRRRAVLGEDHPDTLASAANLAADLRALGRDDEARELEKDIRARHQRLLRTA
jgi:tetratricopeptide (TPR) repeat protein